MITDRIIKGKRPLIFEREGPKNRRKMIATNGGHNLTDERYSSKSLKAKDLDRKIHWESSFRSSG